MSNKPKVKSSKKALSSVNITENPLDGFTEKAFADTLSVGHQPAGELSPQDQVLYRALQANLLSLISHELKTPLTGILNATALLEDADISFKSGARGAGSFSGHDLLIMLRQNADRLHRTLAMLLDLAAIESGTFRARLSEIVLERHLKARFTGKHKVIIDNHPISFSAGKSQETETHILADPRKLERALDLCLQIMVRRIMKGSNISIRIVVNEIQHKFIKFESAMDPSKVELWNKDWLQGLAGYESGISSPSSPFASAFSGVLQSEQEFLRRQEEGLGSELILIHEIMKLQHGKLNSLIDEKRFTLTLEFPSLSSEEGLNAILASRMSRISDDLHSVGLVLIQIPTVLELPDFSQKINQKINQKIRKTLFKTTDTVHSLPEQGLVALILDDCKAEDGLKVMKRITKVFNRGFAFGAAHCPTDTIESKMLIDICRQNILKTR